MPIKRDEHLQTISRDHHHGLLLCWKIKTGFKKQIEPARIKKYADWFYKNHLVPHFDVEEKYVFPVLGNDHAHVKRALLEHDNLKRYFDSETDIIENLASIESELQNHIRFEERVLFNEIQAIATEQQLQDIQKYHHDGKFVDNTEDVFWL